MIRSKYQDSIRSLLKQDGLTEEELLDLHLLQLKMDGLGMGPLLPEPIKRVPYDSLYLKQKRLQEI
jgi:hypothetical protein